MKVVYVSGPITANHYQMMQNIYDGEDAALHVWKMGAAAICPHSLGRYQDNIGIGWEGWLKGDEELIKRSDIVLMLPNWELSPGARREHEFAKRNGIIVVYSLEELKCLVGSNHTVPTSTPSPAAPTIPANGATQLDLFQTSPSSK